MFSRKILLPILMDEIVFKGKSSAGVSHYGSVSFSGFLTAYPSKGPALSSTTLRLH